MDREINQTVKGTYTIEDDKVIFLGDGVRTTAYIQGKNLIVKVISIPERTHEQA